MKPMHYALSAAAMTLVVALAIAQDQAADGEKSSEQSAERVLNELLQRRAENPLIEPARPAPGRAGAADAARLGKAMGTAPGAKPVQLKREGSFIVMRRGRLVRGEGGLSPWLFVFEADSDGLADPPMYLSPCRALEDLEATVAETGDRVVFTVSGQVYVYRQANYLLVTLWKLAPRRGNLEP